MITEGTAMRVVYCHNVQVMQHVAYMDAVALVTVPSTHSRTVSFFVGYIF